MGRRSNTVKARISNLPRPKEAYKPTVQEIPDEEHSGSDSTNEDLLEQGFFIMDDGLTDEEENEDSDFEEDIDEEELEDLRNEADIEHFNAILMQAQIMAVKAEREAAGEKPKRKRHYTGNSDRTKRHHAQKRRELAAGGQKFIHSMFAKAEEKKADSRQVGNSCSSFSSNSELPLPTYCVIEDEPEEGDDEVVNAMNNLFPKGQEVSKVILFNREDLGCSQCQNPKTRTISLRNELPDESQNEKPSEPLCSGNSKEDPEAEAQKKVEELLCQLREGKRPHDDSPETNVDQYLNGLCYKDFPSLRRAKAKLTVKGKDKKLDVFFRSRITAMVATLNLYLDTELTYSWRDSSIIAAKAMGRGVNHARNLRKWICTYLHSEKLPLHRYGKYHSSILDDEDFRQDIQLHLSEISKKGYIRAQDIVDYVITPEVQAKLGTKACSISIYTARRWLHKLSWRYRQQKKGMYIDGHEREDVVEYRKAFVKRWKEYEKRFVIYDNDGNVVSTPTGFPVPQGVRFRLILVTHDESTFYENDRRKTHWIHNDAKPVAQKKGEGQSIMASDFLTLEWGRLTCDDE